MNDFAIKLSFIQKKIELPPESYFLHHLRGDFLPPNSGTVSKFQGGTVSNFHFVLCFHIFGTNFKKKNSRTLWWSRRRNPAALPQARPTFQQPFSLPENAQTLAGIAFRAAGKSVKHFPAVSKFAGKLFQQGTSDSHSLLEFSDNWAPFFREKELNTKFSISQTCLP